MLFISVLIAMSAVVLGAPTDNLPADWYQRGTVPLCRTDTDFTKTTTFVEYFSHTCPHCKAMAIPLDTAVSQVSASSQLNICRIDCKDPAMNPICQKNAVTGYPTLRHYNSDGTVKEEYNGANADVNALTSFLQR